MVRAMKLVEVYILCLTSPISFLISFSYSIRRIVLTTSLFFFFVPKCFLVFVHPNFREKNSDLKSPSFL